jgi:hypothetical protein
MNESVIATSLYHQQTVSMRFSERYFKMEQCGLMGHTVGFGGHPLSNEIPSRLKRAAFDRQIEHHKTSKLCDIFRCPLSSTHVGRRCYKLSFDVHGKVEPIDMRLLIPA